MHFLSVDGTVLDLPVEGLLRDGAHEASRLHDGTQELEVTPESILVVPELGVEGDHPVVTEDLNIHRAAVPVLREARNSDTKDPFLHVGIASRSSCAPVADLVLERTVGIGDEELHSLLRGSPASLC
jgi:hypothetical protein